MRSTDGTVPVRGYRSPPSRLRRSPPTPNAPREAHPDTSRRPCARVRPSGPNSGSLLALFRNGPLVSDESPSGCVSAAGSLCVTSPAGAPGGALAAAWQANDGGGARAERQCWAMGAWRLVRI
eukprot:scaffold21401_cov116-Isochrysis_galbana.AAC.9